MTVKDLEPQVPAEGILKTNDFGTSKWYRVACSCTDTDHDVDFEVEADDFGVHVHTYTTQKTVWWKEYAKKRYDIDNPWLQEFDWFWKDLWNGFVTRLRLTKEIWWNGYVKYQSETMLTKQQALNYAETLKSAIKDVESFEKESRSGKS